MVCLLFKGIQPAFADDSNKKLEQRVEALEKEKQARPIGQIFDRITLSGAIELDYSYADENNVADNTVNDSTSQLDISTVELGLEAAIHEYVTANMVLKGENLDSDTDRIFFDEVFITLQKDGIPIYFIGGKRCQPFGQFESLFINDPITQDLYEINKTGATIGFLGLDFSFTAYKKEIAGQLGNQL